MVISVKRFIRRGWGRLRRKNVYYFRRPKEDGRNPAARTLDLAVIVFVLWLVALVFFRKYFPGEKALIFSLFFGAAAWTAGRRYQKRLTRIRRERYLLWLAGEKCREEIKKLKNRQDTTLFVSLLLARLPQFSDLKVNRKKGKKHHPEIDEAIAISAVYKGIPVGVQCLPPADAQGEKIRLVQSFCRALGERGLHSGLVVSPGENGLELRRLIGEMRKKFRIVFLDENRLFELAARTGWGEGAEVLPGAGKKEEAESGAGFFRQGFLAGKKAKQYLLSACFLGLVSFLANPQGLLGRFYAALIVFNLVLAVTCLAVQRLGEDSLDLEELQP
jgi:hypothetical protein